MPGTRPASAKSSWRWSMSAWSASFSTASSRLWPSSSRAARLRTNGGGAMTHYPYLKIDHVDKTFTRGSTETVVLKDITLGIEKGQFVSIIGHSGCGKSTLLNLVAGLIPVTAGGVLLENKEV